MVLMTTDCEACEEKDYAREVLREQLKTLQTEYDTLALDYAGCQRDLTAQRREITRLRRELVPARQRNPRHKLLSELAAEWKHQTGHHRALVPLEGKRCQAINRALDLLMADPEAKLTEAQAAQRVRQAFVGAGRFPFVVSKQRSPTGTESQRYDDVDTVLRDEKQIEKLATLAETQVSGPKVGSAGAHPSSVAPAPPRIEFVYWQAARVANHRLIARWLKDTFGNGLESLFVPGGRDFPCPRCKNDPACTLTLWPERAVSRVLCECGVCGLDDRLILKRLAERAAR